MLPTIAYVFILSVLILVHEFGHFLIAKWLKVRVEIFSLGFGKKILAYKKKDTEYRLSLIPLGGFVKLAGDDPQEELKGQSWEYLSKPVSQRAAIVFAGPLLNYLIAFLLFSFVFFIGMPTLTSKVGKVLENYPAQQAGLQKDDRIISIDGGKVRFWEEISSIIHSKTKEEKVNLEIQRQNQTFVLEITPRVEKIKDVLGREVKIGLIGIEPSDEVEVLHYGLFKSVNLGAQQIIKLTQLTYQALYKMLVGKMSVKESVTGPIGIYFITEAAVKLGIVYLLRIMAALSVSLAIINLLPLPVLDGGHLMFLFFEKIRGKSMSIKVQEIATRISVSLLVALMVFVFYNDFLRFGILEKLLNLFFKK